MLQKRFEEPFVKVRRFLQPQFARLRHELLSRVQLRQEDDLSLPHYRSFTSRPVLSESYKQVASVESDKLHNRYCNYVLLTRERVLTNQFLQWFPYLKTLTNQAELSKLQLYIDNNGDLLRNLDNWKELQAKYLSGLDLQQAFVLVLFLERVGLSEDSLQFASKMLGLQCKREVIVWQIERVRTYDTAGLPSKVKSHLKVTIEHNQQINQLTVPNTTRQMFCPACWIYDCKLHKVPIENKYLRFAHPKNQVPGPFADPAVLVEHYQAMMEGRPIAGEECSKDCYLRMGRKKYERLANSQVAPPLIRSIVRIGLQIFGYKPCLIWNLIGERFNCQRVFLVLFQDVAVSGVARRLGYESDQQLLECAPIIQKTRRQSKLKDMQFKVCDNEFPYCMHYTIGEQPNLESCAGCECAKRGFCISLCSCPPGCRLMTTGCKCGPKSSCKDSKCVCFQNEQECDPDLCVGCFTTHQRMRLNKCKNNELQLNIQSRMVIGKSDVPCSGLGCFSAEGVKKDYLLGRYTGEVTREQDFVRESIAGSVDYFYSYDYKTASKQSIDAKYFGNKTRFINHSLQHKNCKTRTRFSLSEYYMGVYAEKDVKQGDELFLDYDEGGILSKNYNLPWIKQ